MAMKALFAILASCLSLSAATITGSLLDVTGSATDKAISFQPMDAPWSNGINSVYVPGSITIRSSGGLFSLTLAQGSYRVSIDGQSVGFIRVPSGNGSYDISTVFATFTYLSSTVTQTPATNIWDFASASWLTNLTGNFSFTYATNGVAGQVALSIYQFQNGQSTNCTVTLATGWMCPNGATLTVTNGGVLWLYGHAYGDTGSSANQTNIMVDAKFYK